MTDPEMKEQLAKIQPDLRQQFAVAGVSNLVMEHIAKATFCTVAKFQVFAFNPERGHGNVRASRLRPDGITG